MYSLDIALLLQFYDIDITLDFKGNAFLCWFCVLDERTSMLHLFQLL